MAFSGEPLLTGPRVARGAIDEGRDRVGHAEAQRGKLGIAGNLVEPSEPICGVFVGRLATAQWDDVLVHRRTTAPTNSASTWAASMARSSSRIGRDRKATSPPRLTWLTENDGSPPE